MRASRPELKVGLKNFNKNQVRKNKFFPDVSGALLLGNKMMPGFNKRRCRDAEFAT